MIQSRQEYLQYLEADRISLNLKGTLKQRLFEDVWKFQRLLRKCEYLTNCKKNTLYRLYTWYRFRQLSTKFGFSIPLNVFGPGLAISHRGTIAVNPGARIGANCRLHVCVNIGTEAGKSVAAPTIGDNCYIGPGAKLFGEIVIGPNTAIGANAVVNKSFPDGNVTLGGIPAKVISQKSTAGLLTEGFNVANRSRVPALSEVSI